MFKRWHFRTFWDMDSMLRKPARVGPSQLAPMKVFDTRGGTHAAMDRTRTGCETRFGATFGASIVRISFTLLASMVPGRTKCRYIDFKSGVQTASPALHFSLVARTTISLGLVITSIYPAAKPDMLSFIVKAIEDCLTLGATAQVATEERDYAQISRSDFAVWRSRASLPAAYDASCRSRADKPGGDSGENPSSQPHICNRLRTACPILRRNAMRPLGPAFGLQS